MTHNQPDLSVVVTVVEGEPALTRCLEALSQQDRAPSMEILVPYDDTVPEVVRLVERFPAVRFLDLGSISTGITQRSAFTDHRLYDIRRARGLRAATGKLVAILEDRGRPRADWARAMVDLHERTACAAIGGAIENGAGGLWRWAVFFCDFGRFQAPLADDNPEYLSDTNICYKRAALEATQELWRDRYQEPRVHWALRRQGMKLLLSDRPVTIQERGAVGIVPLLQERVHWARLFGQIRGREISRARCLLLAAATPLLPLLLFVRSLKRQIGKRRNVWEFSAAAPITVVLLHFWSLGEFLGYLDCALARSSPL